MELGKLDKPWKNLVAKWCESDESDKLLFHYTSSDVLSLLCRHKTIWATYANHSNDSTEFEHGIDIFIDEISKFEFHFKASQNHNITAELIKFLKTEKRAPIIKPFIFCLSEESDLLSQWRGYTRRGTDLNVGFDTRQMAFDEFHVLKRAIYDEPTKRAEVKQVIGDFDRLVTAEIAQAGSISAARGRELFLFLLRCIYIKAASFKHPAFYEEKEWRVIIYPSEFGLIKSRPRENKTVLYVEWKLEPLPIANIKFGPTCALETQESVEVILKGTGVLISKSSIPFQ